MPTLIVTASSNPRKGQINQQDLSRIIKAFETVQVQSPDRPVIKIDTISIPALLIKHLLDEIKEADMDTATINVKFGITLPGQTDCRDNESDVSNHLTVALVVESGGNERMAEGDFVITPGFREYLGPDKITDGACCPVIRPRP